MMLQKRKVVLLQVLEVAVEEAQDLLEHVGGLGGGVLDSRVMDFGLKIPLQYKIHGEEQTGKWIVRQAFEGCLPDHLIY